MNSPLAQIPLTFTDYESAYAQAVAVGANETLVPSDEERLLRPLRLLTAALTRLPDLAVNAEILQALLPHAEHRAAYLQACGEATEQLAAGMLRLAHRALEVHARDVGYDPAQWTVQAAELCALLVDEAHRGNAHPPLPAALVRRAGVQLARAAASTEADRMAVAEATARASADLLALFLLGRQSRA